MSQGEAAKIRASLPHPVIDCDGHWQESSHVFQEYLREVAGPTLTAASTTRCRRSASTARLRQFITTVPATSA